MANSPGSLSPRQRMINMMYLVLTALLALNVSKEVLNAFHSVNYGLSNTNESTIINNDQVYSQFSYAAERNPVKAGPWKEKAFQVKSDVDEIESMIKEIKFELVKKTDKGVISFIGHVDEDGDAKKEKIKDISYADFIKANPSLKDKEIGFEKDGKLKAVQNDKNREASWTILRDKDLKKEQIPYGPNLKEKIDNLNNLLQDLSDGNDNLQKSITKILSTEGKKKESIKTPILPFLAKSESQGWLAENFKDMPAVAAYTILTKLENDILSVEADVIKYLQKEIDAGAIKMTGGQAIVKAKKEFIFSGEEFIADVFFGASDTTKEPVIYIGNYKKNEDGSYRMTGSYDSLSVVGGRGKYVVETKKVGLKSYGGLLKIMTDNETKFYPFQGEYLVAKRTVVVSPVKMNTFYILASKGDIDKKKIDEKNGNPVEVSVPGYAQENLSIACYEMTRDGKKWKSTKNKIKSKRDGKGKFLVYPTKTGRAVVKVIAKQDGQNKTIGSKEFKVKRVPNPELKLIGGKNGKISRSKSLSSAARLQATMGSGFDFDGVKYRVTGFTFLLVGDAEQVSVKGYKLSTGGSDQKKVANILKTLSVGDKFLLTDIRVKGPDGKPRPMDSKLFTITN
ncbi:MAG: hypothetical protein CMP58_00045 [Flavobacteriales bacterium]|nr:hypothetical protein [Flavobacteriales bacterium]